MGDPQTLACGTDLLSLGNACGVSPWSSLLFRHIFTIKEKKEKSTCVISSFHGLFL